MVTILTKKPIYWECVIDGHSKFWAAQIIEEKKETIGNTYKPQSSWLLTRKWGAIGTEGQRMEQTYDDRYEAEKVLDKLIWEKESKGYKPIF